MLVIFDVIAVSFAEHLEFLMARIENQIPQLRLSIVFWGNDEMNKVSESEILLKNIYTPSQLRFNNQ